MLQKALQKVLKLLMHFKNFLMSPKDVQPSQKDANQTKYGWIKVVRFTIDQYNHGYEITMKKDIQYTMKKNF